MKQTIDMSPDAVTGRMIALDQLWELSVALKTSSIGEEDGNEDSTFADQIGVVRDVMHKNRALLQKLSE